MIRLTLNNKEVEAKRGMTLLELVRREMIPLPALCYHPALKPSGSCRLCLVEVSEDQQNFSSSDLFTACNYPAKAGITVWTDSRRVRKTRAVIFELLLAHSPSALSLHQLAASFNTESSRLSFPTTNNEKCILCGLCVTVCRDIIQKNAISLAYRGPRCQVTASPKGSSPDCIGCTACAFVCPTGAITVEKEGGNLRLSPWETELPLAPCSRCGALFVAQKTAEHVGSFFKLTEEKEQLCPACRRQETAGSLQDLNMKSSPTIKKNIQGRDENEKRSTFP